MLRSSTVTSLLGLRPNTVIHCLGKGMQGEREHRVKLSSCNVMCDIMNVFLFGCRMNECVCVWVNERVNGCCWCGCFCCCTVQRQWLPSERDKGLTGHQGGERTTTTEWKRCTAGSNKSKARWKLNCFTLLCGDPYLGSLSINSFRWQLEITCSCQTRSLTSLTPFSFLSWWVTQLLVCIAHCLTFSFLSTAEFTVQPMRQAWFKIERSDVRTIWHCSRQVCDDFLDLASMSKQKSCSSWLAPVTTFPCVSFRNQVTNGGALYDWCNFFCALDLSITAISVVKGLFANVRCWRLKKSERETGPLSGHWHGH